MKHLILSIGFIFIFIKTSAQKDSSNHSHLYRMQYRTEVGTFISTSAQMPFWFRSNQYGIVPNQAPILTFRGGLSYDYDKLKPKKYDWGYGIDAAINVGAENKVYLPEAYLKVKLNKFEFYAGRRREIFGIVDTTLTSGSYSWSGNALPIPKIQLSIPEYLPLKFTNNLIAFKGGYAHGWFDNQGVIKDFYLHQKWFYLRLGKPQWKIKMYAGFNHEAQWAGVPSIKMPAFVVNEDGRYASGLKTYIYVVEGSDINASVPQSAQGQYATNDVGSRTGNHLGTFDGAIEINLPHSQVLIYRQNIFETAGLFYLNNIEDGLNGISWKRTARENQQNHIEAVVIEYLYTKSQGGPLGPDAPLKVQRGEVNYFNHNQYLNGWTHQGEIIGTPFFTLQKNFIPLQNEAIFNNRISMLYVGMRANFNQVKVESRFAYSQNFGTYINPINKNQFSSILTLSTPFKRIYQLKLSTSFDLGTLLNNNLGIFVSIKRTGVLK